MLVQSDVVVVRCKCVKEVHGMTRTFSETPVRNEDSVRVLWEFTGEKTDFTLETNEMQSRCREGHYVVVGRRLWVFCVACRS